MVEAVSGDPRDERRLFASAAEIAAVTRVPPEVAEWAWLMQNEPGAYVRRIGRAGSDFRPCRDLRYPDWNETFWFADPRAERRVVEILPCGTAQEGLPDYEDNWGLWPWEWQAFAADRHAAARAACARLGLTYSVGFEGNWSWFVVGSHDDLRRLTTRKNWWCISGDGQEPPDECDEDGVVNPLYGGAGW